ncbi:uncharacterized protein LOC120002286 [Tripterygium wilfordii]|uniref:uncharacterized protein LOC120002286 n=1 Tax=Tripterygium wilfordii TaxID=458696 RepID=UPI0018F80E7B|nr:uncharacterized protein LOC120002286 [Tripterygium wilfordii]
MKEKVESAKAGCLVPLVNHWVQLNWDKSNRIGSLEAKSWITMASQNPNNLSLRSVLEKDKLNGTNFIDWYRNLRIVLKHEKKLYVLERVVPEEPPATAPRVEKDVYKKHQDDSLDVGCLMLATVLSYLSATMNSELQKQHENMEAFEMIEHLKKLFQEQARQERYDISKALFQCRMVEGSSVNSHVLKMIGYIEDLERLGFKLNKDLATDLVLQSLPDNYSQFVLNYNMSQSF